MEHALVRRDFRMHDDVLRTQSRSLAAGCVVAALAMAVCVILALMRPQGAIGAAPIVMARESGAMYVRIDDTLHPVLNLASARLAAGAAASPVMVGEAEIARAKRGPQVGIAGAPTTVGAPLSEQSWTVCDGDRTVVIVGATQSATDRLDRSRGVLVTPRDEPAAPIYLLYDGLRAEVDLRSNAVVRALRLDGVVPLPVSRALLDLVPEAPPIVVPAIARLGTPGGLRGIAVGTVVRVARAESAEFYVVLAQADGDGPNVDGVVVPAGRSAYVRSVGIRDAGGGGTRFLVDDAGVVFGIRDEAAASHLGLLEPPAPAPWPVLARLPRGPELSTEAASVVRDAVSPFPPS
jgi:type VII secretion protein EccB